MLDQEINKEFIKSAIWLSIGLLALFIGHMLDYQQPVMDGIAIGFSSVGIGQILLFAYLKKTKDPRMINNFELEKDERNTYITTKARHTAFWVTYVYIFIAYVFGNSLHLTLQQFLILTLILMPIFSLTLVFLYHKKY